MYKKKHRRGNVQKKTIKNTVAADARGRGVLSENNLFFFKKKRRDRVRKKKKRLRTLFFKSSGDF